MKKNVLNKLGIDCAEIDSAKIVEDNDEFLVVPAIIAREGVYRYPEGMAYKPADELREAAERMNWKTPGVTDSAHPTHLILDKPDDLKGRVENPEFNENIKGIRANLRFIKKKLSPQFLEDIKSGRRKDVSIGFFYRFDATPGEFNGGKYDFAQRDILIDHVAAGVPVGRCRSPFCGIAVDAFAVDPYESIAELPESVKVLPKEAQEMFLKVVNAALEQYDGDEQKAFATAWAAVKKKWKKVDDKWVKKTEAGDQEDRGSGLDQEGELEKKREAAKQRCGKYPISFKEDKGHLTKPEEYKDVPEDDFADPCNFKYPMVPEDRLRNAWQRLHIEENRVKGGYSEAEWNWMKNRVEKRMKAKGIEVKADVSVDAEKEIERTRQLVPLLQ